MADEPPKAVRFRGARGDWSDVAEPPLVWCITRETHGFCDPRLFVRAARLVQKLREVLRADARSAPMQSAPKMQQAAEIAAHQALGARRLHRRKFAVEHAGRNLGVLHREQPAESAAFFLIAHVDLPG